jgi:phosphoribosylformimino-5-aminoimidazole carboxamide ribonucleotide (ProFAR) isomerase
MLQGTDLEWFRRLRGITGHELTAAGGITTLQEVRALLDLGIHVALGMAIYTGTLQLGDLAKMSKASVEKTNTRMAGPADNGASGPV